MKRVFYKSDNPKTFEEHLDIFGHDFPYTITIKRFATNDIVPLHCADTIEILVCENLIGEITVGNTCFALGGDQVFVAPPNTVHSNNIRACDGTLYVLQVSFEAMANFIRLPDILACYDKDVSQLAFTCPEYDSIHEAVLEMVREDEDLFACLGYILRIFSILSRYADNRETQENGVLLPQNTFLQELIKWTQENFQEKVTIEDVAKKMGYNKYYFCNRFKAMTGTTYMNYLNGLRIAHACRLLREGRSTGEVCFLCGFDNVSYFIQVFKKYQGITPKGYVVSDRSG